MRAALVGALLSVAMLAGCNRNEPIEAEPQIPPAEPRPANIGGIKWAPESARYQQIRREAFREGRDFSARVDFATEQISRKGLYKVLLLQGGDKNPVGEFERWRVLLTHPDGTPVHNATLHIKGGMPQHGHGLPTQPKITPAGAPGEYIVEGLQFSMPGWWEVSFYISSGQRDDSVTLNIKAG